MLDSRLKMSGMTGEEMSGMTEDVSGMLGPDVFYRGTGTGGGRGRSGAGLCFF